MLNEKLHIFMPSGACYRNAIASLNGNGSFTHTVDGKQLPLKADYGGCQGWKIDAAKDKSIDELSIDANRNNKYSMSYNKNKSSVNVNGVTVPDPYRRNNVERLLMAFNNNESQTNEVTDEIFGATSDGNRIEFNVNELKMNNLLNTGNDSILLSCMNQNQIKTKLKVGDSKMEDLLNNLVTSQIDDNRTQELVPPSSQKDTNSASELLRQQYEMNTLIDGTNVNKPNTEVAELFSDQKQTSFKDDGKSLDADANCTVEMHEVNEFENLDLEIGADILNAILDQTVTISSLFECSVQKELTELGMDANKSEQIDSYHNNNSVKSVGENFSRVNNASIEESTNENSQLKFGAIQTEKSEITTCKPMDMVINLSDIKYEKDNCFVVDDNLKNTNMIDLWYCSVFVPVVVPFLNYYKLRQCYSMVK